MNNRKDSHLYAVVDGEGYIMWTRGGSSVRARLMVYGVEKHAAAALNKQFSEAEVKKHGLYVQCIYARTGGEANGKQDYAVIADDNSGAGDSRLSRFKTRFPVTRPGR